MADDMDVEWERGGYWPLAWQTTAKLPHGLRGEVTATGGRWTATLFSRAVPLDRAAFDTPGAARDWLQARIGGIAASGM